MNYLRVDDALLARIKGQFELRTPNFEAVESVAIAISEFLDVNQESDTYTCIVDAATGVGKTFVMAGLIEYLSQERGWRNFIIVTPGVIVRDKTIANFTHGNDRSLVDCISLPVEVITSENFNKTSTATLMDDTNNIKV